MSNKIQDLIKKLNDATEAYDKGTPYITDEEWDQLYFTLIEKERKTGIIYPDSPTQKIHYKTVLELKKVTHNHPMLSLDKTKDIKTIESFLKDHGWIAMAKMDGLTCSLRYIDGKLVSAETRGNGIVGEDITHNAMVIPSIPNRINFKNDLIIDGEIICTYNNFKPFENDYKNPRNFAAGSIRLLDAKECSKRNLTFVAWDIINGDKYLTLTDKLQFLTLFNFTTVPYINSSEHTAKEAIILIQNSCKGLYPIDGIVFKYDSIKEYNDAGRTDHHFKGGLAYKFYDELYDTKLRNIEWTMGRTGVLTPVAIYDDVNIEGTICNRANLHNLSVMNALFHNSTPYVGQNIKVFKSNLIIPQIYSTEEYEIEDEVEYQFLLPPIRCPYCGELTKVRQDNESKILYCNNPNCEGKLINRLDHFLGKKGLDIKGISKATLEKLIDWEWVNSLADVFKLKEKRAEWIKKEGFGVASVDKVLNAIEEGRSCNFSKYLCALGIPLIGKVASNSLEKEFISYDLFRKAVKQKDERLYNIAGIGEVMIQNLLNFNYTEADFIYNNFIKEITPVVSSTNTDLNGKIFCITGKLKEFKNRDELKKVIESRGGKVTGSVSSKTNYLINNDINSTSSKNETAKKLGIPIITEEDFKNL